MFFSLLCPFFSVHIFGNSRVWHCFILLVYLTLGFTLRRKNYFTQELFELLLIGKYQSLLICTRTMPLFSFIELTDVLLFFPSQMIFVPHWKLKVCCLSQSSVVSWPHPEEPQVWGRRRKFWRKPTLSIWLTPCEEALKLLSLIHHQQVPPPVCQQAHPPGKKKKSNYTNDYLWQSILKVFYC